MFFMMVAVVAITLSSNIKDDDEEYDAIDMWAVFMTLLWSQLFVIFNGLRAA
jgi:hypothetical protein